MDAIITVPQNLAIDIQKIATHYRKDFQDASLLAPDFGVKEVLEGISSFEIPRTSGRPASDTKTRKSLRDSGTTNSQANTTTAGTQTEVESEPSVWRITI